MVPMMKEGRILMKQQSRVMASPFFIILLQYIKICILSINLRVAMYATQGEGIHGQAPC